MDMQQPPSVVEPDDRRGALKTPEKSVMELNAFMHEFADRFVALAMAEAAAAQRLDELEARIKAIEERFSPSPLTE